MNFFQEQFFFYLTLFLVMLVPGYFLLTALFSKKSFSRIEIFVFSVAMSIISVDFLMIALGKTGITINQWSVISSIILFSAGCFLIQKKFPKKETVNKKKKQKEFSKNQTILIVLLLFLTFFIKGAHLKNAIFPTATDLGHHMYWSKLISQTGELPTYQKSTINKETFQIDDPEPIADFIIGEHLIFSAINLISKIEYVSYFPTITLLFINIVGILAVFIFTLKLFEKNKLSQNISIATLLFIGPLYAISSPQSSFVSGGVIGNVLGNLLIPTTLYFFLRSLREKSSWMLFTAILSATGMAYTHHLSTFIFVYIFAFIFVIFNIALLFDSFYFSERKNDLKKLFSAHKRVSTDWLKIIFSKNIITLLFFIIIFFIFIFTPAYIETKAVETAVGAPSKATRAGISLTEIKFSIGESRMILAVLGFLTLCFARFKKKNTVHSTYTFAFATGWFLSIFMMITQPELMHLNLPSGRIANYFVFPTSILAGFFTIWLFNFIRNRSQFHIPGKITYALFLIIFAFIFANGMYDNSESVESSGNYKEANQTYHASQYLANNPEFSKTDVIVKDHNYLKADTWMKIFFMKDYNFPFSRSYFKRYEDPTKPREMCSLWMISVPASDNAKRCFDETKTNFIVLNPKNDSVQFNNLKEFNKIYTGKNTAIYFKNK